MTNPYMDLPPEAFWRTGVADLDMMDIKGLWTPKYKVGRWQRFATFGSCFAQHFGKALVRERFKWHDGEPAPVGMSDENKNYFNYERFSVRTANIYTTSLLNQWVSWALNIKPSPEIFWEKDGRIYDPFRPRIEPNGFASVEEMLRSRQLTIEAFGDVIRTTSVFVFTLGLTESWFDVEGGYEYPMCPGTAAGDFDEKKHKFMAQSYDFVEKNLNTVIGLLRAANPNIMILLTVSPVPLTATNSGKHVLVASSASKSILRAVAETTANTLPYVDYFPSYEIINSPVFKGAFFKPNQREVEQFGVDFVMRNFFAGIGHEMTNEAERERIKVAEHKKAEVQRKMDEIACEEEILAQFASEGAKP